MTATNEKEQKQVPRAAAGYAQQLKIEFLERSFPNWGYHISYLLWCCAAVVCFNPTALANEHDALKSRNDAFKSRKTHVDAKFNHITFHPFTLFLYKPELHELIYLLQQQSFFLKVVLMTAFCFQLLRYITRLKTLQSHDA